MIIMIKNYVESTNSFFNEVNESWYKLKEKTLFLDK